MAFRSSVVPYHPQKLVPGSCQAERIHAMLDKPVARLTMTREESELKQLAYERERRLASDGMVGSIGFRTPSVGYAALVFSSIFSFVVWGAKRAHRASLWSAECHGAGELDVPRDAELLLHWVLGRRCRSLPGDLGEEYQSKIGNGDSLLEAERWYSLAGVPFYRTRNGATGRVRTNAWMARSVTRRG